MRHTTFRFALAPTPAQAAMLARHAGASRFAYNQCLRLVADALAAKRADPQVRVPWSGFDLINAYNAWKRGEAAGRIFVAATDGAVTKQVTGLAWRREVSAQVFEEAAVDLGRALSAYAAAKAGKRKGRVGFPRLKRKGRSRDSFRLRNKPRSAGTARAGTSASTCKSPSSTPIDATSLAPPAIVVASSGWTAALPRSWWRPPRMGLRLAVGRHPSRCSEAWCACGGCPGRSPALSPARAIGPRRPGGCLGSTPGSPMCVEASSTKSPASSSRPTTGSVWKTSPSPI